MDFMVFMAAFVSEMQGAKEGFAKNSGVRFFIIVQAKL
jgi:hypothetical protein